MPVPIAAVAASAAGGVAMEYLIQRGKPTKKEIVLGGAVGAIPGIGLGIKGGLKLGGKVGRIAQLTASSKRFKDLRTIALGAVHPGTPVYLTGHISRFVAGAAAQAVLGMAYDRIHTQKIPSQAGRGATRLSQSARRSVRPGIGKVRKRCKHRNKAGKQCLRPAGHSGRHRYR